MKSNFFIFCFIPYEANADKNVGRWKSVFSVLALIVFRPQERPDR